MNDTPTTGAAPPQADRDFERQLREMNEALLVSLVRQHELAEQAQKTEAVLRETHAKLQAHAEDLDRFNRVAVGRELRMIDLKKEVNELRQRQGEAARYPLESEPEIEPTKVDSPTTPLPASDSLVPLESVLCIEELDRRPSRPPNYETENSALMALVQSLADSPGTILQTLAEKILEAIKADSAGISLLTKDEKSFCWPAIAGMWQPHIGGGTPRDFGPCGDVLDRNAPLLFRHYERRYAYFLPVTPPVEECLLVPFYIDGKAVGTIWAIAHDDRRKFDSEDLRQLESLGRFASAAYRAVELLQVQDSRHGAALNLMEDAVQSRQAMETFNVQLRESHARFEALFAASPVGMYLVDAELRIRLVSRKAQPVFGDIGELIGSDFVKVMHILWPLKSADEIVAHFRHTLETGEPYSAPEFSEDRYDRKVREYYDWQIHRIAMADGQYGVVCYFIDISERMRMSSQLQQYSADLLEADHRKNEFLAMLAHELRNPLAPIRNALQIMRLTGGNGEAVKPVTEMMERQVGQMVRLVDDLLDANRISRGKIELRRGRIELASAVNEAVEAVSALYLSMNHDLNVTLPPQPIYLNGDPARLAQVVGNLLNNACKFTDIGGRISLTVEREGEQAVIRVRDDGIGIASDQLPGIFDMFMQVDTSLERSVSGLGIGLTLVKNLVEMHAGTVEAHSAGIGQGSEFVVRLPIVETPEPLPLEPTLSEPTTTTARRILVVDDNRDSAASLAMLLQLKGNDIRTAHDGLEALEVAEMFHPELVLLDIGLPKLNGYEVARRIRQQAWGRDMILVALTGWGQDEDRLRSQEAGFNFHILKPVELAELMKLLTETSPTQD